MAWLDNMVKEWTRGIAEGEDLPDLHVFLHMTEVQWAKWQRERPQFVVGSDEVGYGCVAGPLVVCAVCAPYGWSIPGLADSKTFKDKKKLEEVAYRLYDLHKDKKIRYAVSQGNVDRIDELGVVTALRMCHVSALDMAGHGMANLMRVSDGEIDLPGEDDISIPKADGFIPQVMAASIIAKYVRDGFMSDMAEQYPGYGFEKHAGYYTKVHKAAIEKLGPCPLHRMSYAPFRKDEDDSGYGENIRAVGEVDRAAT